MYICLYHQKFKGQYVSIPTSESQLRLDMYICLYHQKFKRQCVSIPSGFVQTSTLARAGLHIRAFFAHIPH